MEFLWYDGTRLSVENWDDDEPNALNKECVKLDGTGLWSDTPCSGYKAVVCEKGLSASIALFVN